MIITTAELVKLIPIMHELEEEAHASVAYAKDVLKYSEFVKEGDIDKQLVEDMNANNVDEFNEHLMQKLLPHACKLFAEILKNNKDENTLLEVSGGLAESKLYIDLAIKELNDEKVGVE